MTESINQENKATDNLIIKTIAAFLKIDIRLEYIR